jgi:hypothetical protein
VAAGTNIKEPNAESNKPADNVFYPNFCKTSTFNDTKKIIDPTKYAT